MTSYNIGYFVDSLILSFCNSPQTNSIEAYIQFEPGLITDDGEVTNDTTADFLRTLHERIPASSRECTRCCPETPDV